MRKRDVASEMRLSPLRTLLNVYESWSARIISREARMTLHKGQLEGTNAANVRYGRV